MVTPLQHWLFFKGIWRGKGQFRLHGLLRFFVPDQTIDYIGRTHWFSDDFWISEEDFTLSHSGEIHRTTYIRNLGNNRLHTTCDDILGGADILLREDGFSHTPYSFRSAFGRRYLLVECLDDATVDQQGGVHDVIRMLYAGVHLATMRMDITIDRGNE